MWCKNGVIVLNCTTNLRTMATLKFFIRTTVKDKPANIRCRIRLGRDHDLYANTQIRVKAAQWSDKKEDIKEVVSIEVRDHFYKLKTHLNNAILRVTAEDLSKTYPNKQNWLEFQIDQFHNPQRELSTLFQFTQNFIDHAPTRLKKDGKPVCYKMIREYERTFFYMKEYASLRKKEPDFEDIDLNFYNDFMDFLTKKGLATNTIGKKIQTLKIFLNAATDQGLNKNLKFKSKFYAVTEEADTIYLNAVELNLLWELDLSGNDRLENVRDAFLVGCYTGCRFSDLKQITQQNIVGNMINMRQQKTGSKVVIPVHPVVSSILKKYDGETPKLVSNQKFNDYIKEVCLLAGLTEEVEKRSTKGGLTVIQRLPKYQMVASHTARRSFATNLYKKGFPSRSIMQVTGHKTEQAFLKYIRVTPEEHAEMLMNFWLDNGEHLKIAK
jgi:site-specific recombinase XerD